MSCDDCGRLASLVADLRALHRPGVPDRSGRAECKECFDTWPCLTAAALDRHAPVGATLCAQSGHAWRNDGAIPLVCDTCGHAEAGR
jgi:hypothetical protein